jgi:hypothetical protein
LKFQKGREQSTELTEEDGVVSERSFQLLVSWPSHLGELAPEEAITATIEFVRIYGYAQGNWHGGFNGRAY